MEPILTVLLVALLAGCATGLVALAILFADGVSHQVYDAALGLAVGPMVAVISRELIPQSHGHGFADEASLTLFVGFAIMLFVDTALAV